MKAKLKLRYSILCVSLAAAYPLQVQSAAGVAQFAVGEASVRRGDGAGSQLVKGRNIDSGDTIVTGPNGQAQIRFSDGGLVSLRANSQFTISNYADENDPKKDRFLVDRIAR